jgi:hypothetical protein
LARREPDGFGGRAIAEGRLLVQQQRQPEPLHGLHRRRALPNDPTSDLQKLFREATRHRLGTGHDGILSDTQICLAIPLYQNPRTKCDVICETDHLAEWRAVAFLDVGTKAPARSSSCSNALWVSPNAISHQAYQARVHLSCRNPLSASEAALFPTITATLPVPPRPVHSDRN